MRWLITGVMAGLMATQGAGQPDWDRVNAETLQHFQELVRFDTSDPPGGEAPAVAYLKAVLEKERIPVEVFALEANRPNLVARLKGTGNKRPLLIMGHTDVVNVDPKKWTHPPFGAVRDGGTSTAGARGRQGQRRGLADDHGVAEASERPAGPDVIFAEAGKRAARAWASNTDPGHLSEDRSRYASQRRRVSDRAAR